MSVKKKQSRKKVVILGAGFTGLVSAYYLSKHFNVTIIEKEDFFGGSARGFYYKKFTLDYGPHKLYTELPGIMDSILSLTPLLTIKKKNSIYLSGNFYDFPLKITQIAKKMPLTFVKAGFDIIIKSIFKKPDDSYENYLINRFGKTLYNLSFRDYAFKVWSSDPKELDAELAKRRVAVSSIFELAKSMIFKDNKNISAEYFYYPENGMKQLIDALIEEIRKNKGKIIKNTEVSEIFVEKDKVKYVKYSEKIINPDFLISTIPLDSLSKITYINGLKSENVNLAYNPLNIIYFILNKPKALNDCWIFFPEKDIIFQRISEQKAFSPLTSPKNKTALMVETCKEVNDDLIKEIIHQLEKINILNKSEIKEYFVKTIPEAYPIYKKGFLAELNPFIQKIESANNFYLLGRQGLFNYNNIDQCWDMAIKISEQIINKKKKEDWQNSKAYFDSYRIVD